MRQGIIHNKGSYNGFVKYGFSCTKALKRFNFHEKSNLYQVAISAVSAGTAGINIGRSLGKQKHMAVARIALVVVLSSIQYLA